jgi:SAM-dependent methyltransferase
MMKSFYRSLEKGLAALCGRLIIVDTEKVLGNLKNKEVKYQIDLCKEDISRKYIFEYPGQSLNFLDVGARDGKLEYLLGIKENLAFDQVEYERNSAKFHEKYHYYGLDIEPASDEPKNWAIICGDICSEEFIVTNSSYVEFFDVIYSNNVFEHLKRPWVASKNLMRMLKVNGLCITIAPFSLRYHESPGDYFRYTHTGLVSLFEETTKVRTVVSGYDINGRRNNWQGSGLHNDICPVDHFGAWRENWFVVSVIQKVV